MNFKQYVDKERSLYAAFAEIVRTIIQTVLDAQQEIPKPQQIQARAKTPDSLARKLKERGLAHSRSIERELKDLAGVRLIFYTNSDERAFLSSRIINENFNVDYDASKIHHPVGTPIDVNEQYRGIHYVLTLKEDRLKLPEYARFSGLRCEIQIQTILNHAWSETAHDILYHQPDTAAGFGTKQYERIRKRMSSVMEKHLVPAGHEFEKVHHDFKSLMVGKELFDKGVTATLAAATDNNERHDILEKIHKSLLPFYDDVSAVSSELRSAAIKAIKQARKTKTKPIDLGRYGSFRGKTSADVTEEALEIVDRLRYLDIKATLAFLLQIYTGAKSEGERKRILESIKRLSEHNLSVWRKAGSFVQDIIAREISKLSSLYRTHNREVIQCLCENILGTEIRGVSSESYDTVSFQTGAVNGTAKLGETRKAALKVLFELYRKTTLPSEKQEIYKALTSAMSLPNSASYGDALWLLVNRDTKMILEFFLKRGLKEPYRILQSIERRCVFIFRNSIGAKNANPQNPDIVASYADLLGLIERFRELINADETYQKFKTFIGFDPVFEDDLAAETTDFRKRDAIRKSRMDRYLSEIDATTEKEWQSLLQEFAKERDSNQHLSNFAELIGEKKPEIAMRWLKQKPSPLSLALIHGVLKSSHAVEVTSLMQAWITKGTNLNLVARILRFVKTLPDNMIETVAEKALTKKDVEALSDLVVCLIDRGASLDLAFTDRFLVPAIAALSERQSWYWLMNMFPDEQQQLFLEGLSNSQVEAILASLIPLPRIDHHVEAFFKPFAKFHPDLLLEFFQKREAYSKKDEEQYEAIPYSFYELHESLAHHPALMIKTMRAWYTDDSSLFQFKGGRLLSLVFPEFSDSFATALQALVKKDPGAIDFVLGILQNYQGQSHLHETFKVIVNLLPESDERMSSIEIALDATGVVSGEFGFVEAYQEKRAAVEPWLKDKRTRVKKFAARYIRSLNRAIAAEQRRAEGDLQLRKHQFDPETD